MQAVQNQCIRGHTTLLIKKKKNKKVTLTKKCIALQDVLGFTLSNTFREILKPMLNFELGEVSVIQHYRENKTEPPTKLEAGGRRIKSFVKELWCSSWLIAYAHRM